MNFTPNLSQPGAYIQTLPGHNLNFVGPYFVGP